MTSAVLIPGAGGLGWYWHLVERDLQDRGHDAFAVDLAARGRTGLPAYADAVVDAIDGRTDVALVAQSMGPSPPRWCCSVYRSVLRCSSMR
jgi:pimeloyl-ACP methyl ester carboxylesterase